MRLSTVYDDLLAGGGEWARARGLRSGSRFAPDVVLLDDIGCREWMTGWGTEEDRQRSGAAGFDEHLTRPVVSRAIADLPERAAQA